MENKLLRSYFNQEVRIYNLFGFLADGRANRCGNRHNYTRRARMGNSASSLDLNGKIFSSKSKKAACSQ